MKTTQKRKMFLVTNASVMLTALLISTGMTHAQGCLYSDNFSDNNPAPDWFESDNNSTRFRTSERNNRAEFWAPSSNTGGNYISGLLSNGWKIDMTADWAISIDYHVDPPSPTNGDIGLAFVLAFNIDLNQNMLTGYTLSGGIANYGTGDIDYLVDNFWTNGAPTMMSQLNRLFSEATIYIWYDASSGCISHGDALFVPNMTVCGVNSLSNLTTATIGLGGYTLGNVPPSSGSQLWGDNFCIIYGELVGSKVGGCCLADSCYQTLESSCEGTWLGEGSSCEGPTDPCNSCVGDLTGDGLVDGGDLTVVLGFWGQCADPANCLADLTGDGIVDGADLTTVLGFWGPCP